MAYRRLVLARIGLALSAAVVGALLSSAAQAQTPPARWTLTPDLRVGSETRGPDYQFGRMIRLAAPAPDGSVYVVVDDEAQVRQYHAQGAHVKNIGRKGQGPGEFGFIGGIGFLGDTLYVMDPSSRRTSLFTPDGLVAPNLIMWPSGGGEIPWPLALLSDGTAIGSHGVTISGGPRPETSIPIFHMTRTGEVLSTVAWQIKRNYALEIRAGRGGVGSAQPFSDGAHMAIFPRLSRVVVADGPAATTGAESMFKVTVVGATAGTIFSRTYSYLPKPIPKAAVDEAVHASFLGLQALPPSLSEEMRAAFAAVTEDQIRPSFYVPEFAPPITGVLTNDQGGLTWLKREVGPSTDWTVIGPTGDLLATVMMPKNAILLAVAGSIAWGAETDSLDVPSLVRYRITKP